MKNRNMDASMSSIPSEMIQQNRAVKREHSDDYYVSTLLKLKGGVVIRQHSDDADYVPPLNGGKRQKLMECSIVEKERKKVLIGKKKVKTLESLKTRQCPGQLVTLLRRLTDAQKKDVIDMGFEAIFNLKVSAIPRKLACFVCDNFDAVTNTLIIGDKSVQITKQSVHDILGFPIGQNKVNAVARAGKSDDGITNEWRKQYPVFDKGTQRIYVSDVVNKIANNKRGGKLFKMNMLVLMMTLLAEGIKCGTVNQKILPCIENVEEIAYMDWCGYIFDCLRRSKIGWRKDGNKSSYSGPLLFLTLFYVDAIRTLGQNISEVRPAIKYVTNKMLKDLEQNGIQAGGFENFSIAHPIQAVHEWNSEETVMKYINDKGDKGGEEEGEEVNVYIQGEDEVDEKDSQRDEGQDVDVDNEENNSFESKEEEVENGTGINQGYDDVYPNDPQLLIDTISTQPDTNDDTQKDNLIADQMVQTLQRKISTPESGITCVQGYKVKSNIAPILETIFQKHGDIAAKCVFKTASVKTSFLETVCEVVKRILTNDVIEMEEIENEVSDAEAANIDVSWLRAHMANFPKKKDGKMLMDTKENISLANKAAQMDLKEKYTEFLAAEQRFQQAKSRAKVLDLVEKKVNNDILKTKAEKDSWVRQLIL